jgi:sugar phosphate isomerase/epimerase
VKIINLTGDIDKEKYYVNVDHIKHFHDCEVEGSHRFTRVIFDRSMLEVSETSEEIKRLIEGCEEEPRKTKVINLFAGPGAGKTTTAAKLFAAMKDKGLKVELVQEYVKSWAWEGREIGPLDQIYILAKQLRAESRLYGKVDYIITDSPIELSSYYDKRRNNDSAISNVVDDLLSRVDVDRLNVFIKRDKPYYQHGRYETEAEAVNIDEELHEMFDFDLEVKTSEIGPILDFL